MRGVAVAAIVLVAVGACGNGPSAAPRRAPIGSVEAFCSAYRGPAGTFDLADDAAVRRLGVRVETMPYPPELVRDADLYLVTLDIISRRMLEVPPAQRRQEIVDAYATDPRVREGRAAADRIATYALEHC